MKKTAQKVVHSMYCQWTGADTPSSVSLLVVIICGVHYIAEWTCISSGQWEVVSENKVPALLSRNFFCMFVSKSPVQQAPCLSMGCVPNSVTRMREQQNSHIKKVLCLWKQPEDKLLLIPWYRNAYGWTENSEEQPWGVKPWQESTIWNFSWESQLPSFGVC